MDRYEPWFPGQAAKPLGQGFPYRLETIGLPRGAGRTLRYRSRVMTAFVVALWAAAVALALYGLAPSPVRSPHPKRPDSTLPGIQSARGASRGAEDDLP